MAGTEGPKKAWKELAWGPKSGPKSMCWVYNGAYLDSNDAKSIPFGWFLLDGVLINGVYTMSI